MSAAHTPGPWAYVKPDGLSVRHPQVYSDTGPICNATWLGDGRLKELEANARLIAAAPDLLMMHQEIAKLSAGWDEHGSIGPKPPYSWETVARLAMDYSQSAIAKATGELS